MSLLALAIMLYGYGPMVPYWRKISSDNFYWFNHAWFYTLTVVRLKVAKIGFSIVVYKQKFIYTSRRQWSNM
jgi:hypothetical protein